MSPASPAGGATACPAPCWSSCCPVSARPWGLGLPARASFRLCSDTSAGVVQLAKQAGLLSDTGMTTAYYSHPSSLAHDMGTGHPECPQRLQAVARGLADADLERRLVARTPTALASDWLQRLHDPAYIDALVAAVPEQGL